MTGSDTNSFPEVKAHFDDKIQVAFVKRDVDTAAELAAGSDEPLDPTDALRVRCGANDILGLFSLTFLGRGRKKIDRVVLTLMCGT